MASDARQDQMNGAWLSVFFLVPVIEQTLTFELGDSFRASNSLLWYLFVHAFALFLPPVQ